MQNGKNKINNGNKWNNEDGKNESSPFPFPLFPIHTCSC